MHLRVGIFSKKFFYKGIYHHRIERSEYMLIAAAEGNGLGRGSMCPCMAGMSPHMGVN
jgi:hypothetical protein